MTSIHGFTMTDGFGPEHREAAIQLFWQAFRGKLNRVMRPEAKALAFLSSVADPRHCISAVAPDGSLLGIAGYKTHTGAFIGGELGDIQRAYGWFGGLWRGLALSVLERPLALDTLLMDGIMVAETARGQGIGTALLSAIKDTARTRNYAQVRLDVIDINPRARALYEREGFVAQETTHIGPLRHIFGFAKATTMTCPVPNAVP